MRPTTGRKALRGCSRCTSHLSESTRLASSVVSEMRRWLDAHGWSSYDPYDFRGTRAFMALQRRGIGRARIHRAPVRAADELARAAPRLARKLLDVRPATNAHGVALLASAYATLPDAAAGESANACLAWLSAHTEEGWHGDGWGYPFDWQSLTLIPSGMPSGFVSVVAGDAFWRAYE